MTMLIQIPNVLNLEQLKAVNAIMDEARFVDGRLSAGMAARRVKNNTELSESPEVMNQLNNLVMGALVRNPVYQSAALPLKVATPFYAKYGQGQTYGTHVDDPVMGAPDRYRTDLSLTVFLNNPEDYEGGELTIETQFGEQKVKLNAGNAVMYPSGSLHHVAEVTSGERRVAVTWIQSMIRSPEQRELLFNLNQAREKLLKDNPEAEETKKVDVTYINLVRMWAEL
jgi:PKHD-type hydroxylase